MVENIVETVNLSKVYKRKNVEIVALNDVNLQIPKAQIICINGPSGSGKTTLLNIIGGVDRPTRGKVTVDNVDITRLGESQITRFRLEKIGFIFQFHNLFPTLTAFENIELPLILSKKPKETREKRVSDLLEIVGMKERADHKPDELSGGEQQRIAIARALTNNPTLILADEPTGDLDSENAIAFMKLVKELNKKQGQTFLIVTHDPLVSQECDKIYAIRDGKLRE
ncbi:macrolide ABC transporter ATP-binding protein [Candidatus Bathyarchaeota archaeon CG07_land_8_20_14_0_80_47_9]|nr:MAG: macrolide ABC transporter ATP-binding protein [Candidatus Bathyarchaeota archaeon CG07_land_8_20_14_0_80_47_9]